mmetsp:Transcript_22538/g.53933  ORF Transcript_22538/g.53933 Transcript_22538/m.53933 type:complete len:594 (-) Transcript_22538:174-1955(-)
MGASTPRELRTGSRAGEEEEEGSWPRRPSLGERGGWGRPGGAPRWPGTPIPHGMGGGGPPRGGGEPDQLAGGAAVRRPELLDQRLDLQRDPVVCRLRLGGLPPGGLAAGVLAARPAVGRLRCGLLCLLLLRPLRLGLLVHADEDLSLVQAPCPEGAERDAGKRRGHRAEQDDEAVHPEGEEVGERAVEDEEDPPRVRLPEAEAKAKRRDGAHVVEVLPVGVGGRRLVLGHRVDQRVARLGVLHKEPADAQGERPKVVGLHEHGQPHRQRPGRDQDHLAPEGPKLRAPPREPGAAPQDLTGSEHQISKEDQEGPDVLHGAQRVPPDHRDVHCSKRPNDKEEQVRLDGVLKVEVFEEDPLDGLGHQQVDQQEEARVRANQVVDKDVAAPGGNHVRVREAREDPDRPRAAGPEGPRPHEEGQDHGGDRDALVVVAPADRAHDVRGDHRHDEGRRREGVGDPRGLRGEEPCEHGGNTTEPRRHKHADVVERHRQPHCLEHVIQPHGRELHPRVDGRPDRAPDGVPGGVVKPAEELAQPILKHVPRCVEVEPRVKLVDQPPVCADRIEAYVVGAVSGYKDKRHPHGSPYQGRPHRKAP